MGGNIKDANTKTHKVTRECNHCGSDFEDSVKYGPETHCKDCKEKFNDPSYINTSVELDVTKDGEIKVDVIFDSETPDNLRVNVSGKRLEEGLIHANLRLESEEGWCEDIICDAQNYLDHSLGVSREKIKTVTYPDEPETDFREERREVSGELLEGEEIRATVEFQCEELDACSETLTTPEAVAKSI